MIKNIYLKKEEYFNIEVLEKKPVFIVGGRGVGKSYTIKNHVVKNLLKNKFKSKVLYVRINKNEIPTSDTWFLESLNLLKLKNNKNLRIKRGVPHSGCTSITYDIYKKGKKKEIVRHIAYNVSLETSATIKSAVYKDVDIIVFEEFLRSDLNKNLINKYCFNFLELIETVSRGRKMPIIMIGNNLQNYNPLFNVFKDYDFYRLKTETRRENISEGLFSKYLEGNNYSIKPKNEDYVYLFHVKHNNKRYNFHVDRYKYKDIYITDNILKNARTDILYSIANNMIYNYENNIYLFKDSKIEELFYDNFQDIYKKVKINLENYLTY